MPYGYRHEPPQEKPPGFRERVANAWYAASELVATRKEIFSEELSRELGLIARGAVGFVIAAALGTIAILLVTALVATLFSMLFGSAWAGILATLVLYLVGIAAAALFAVKSLQKVRFDFPATKNGLADDWAAVRASLAPPRDVEEEEPEGTDVEQRFRAGSE
jgi:uncharacterized membrane protein YqjE